MKNKQQEDIKKTSAATTHTDEKKADKNEKALKKDAHNPAVPAKAVEHYKKSGAPEEE
jgi:hypothetical protein